MGDRGIGLHSGGSRVWARSPSAEHYKATKICDPVTHKWIPTEKYYRLKAEREGIPDKVRVPWLDLNWPRINKAVTPVKNPNTGKLEFRRFSGRREMYKYYKDTGRELG